MDSPNTDYPRFLSAEETSKLEYQNSRSLSSFAKNKLQKEARLNWDRFYRRNTDHFFKDRHWLLIEFPEIVGLARSALELTDRSGHEGELQLQTANFHWLEVGCGVGNLIFPLFADLPSDIAQRLIVYGCDFSSECLRLLAKNALYNAERIKPFQADLANDELCTLVDGVNFDIVSVIFMLSALQPDRMLHCLKNISRSMHSRSVLVFRDYGVTDYAMIRFGPDAKLCDRQYARQDGTLSYFFYANEVTQMFRQAGFEEGECAYIERTTENKREGLKVSRVFVQGIFRLKCLT